ncbi:MAG: S41 family peptidase [Defluviitaleaceae bacterium]|nr:S41 family peptidase [Defluviitaleaceae bacterium]
MDKNKKRKIIKRVVLTVLIAVFVLPPVAVFAYWMLNGSPNISVSTVERQRTLPDKFFAATEHLEGFATDALYMVQMIERIHPIFIVEGWLPDEYETVRDEFLTYAQNDISTTEFAFAAHKYMTMLRDGHMSGMLASKLDDGGWAYTLKRNGYLNEPWTARDGRLFLTDERRGLKNAEVTAIGGIPTAQVFGVIDTYYYAENEIARQQNYIIFTQFIDVIEKAGGVISDNKVLLTLNQNSELTTLESDIVMPYVLNRDSWPDYIIQYEMFGDVFYIDLLTFMDGEHIKEASKAIKKAIAGGTRKFIIDLRDNGGGNSIVGNKLLEAMGIKVPSYGAVHNITEAAVKQGSIWFLRPFYWLGFNTMRIEPTIAKNLNPNDVFVSVLTNADTYSSARQMAVWVQDGGFGNIIGSPSRNAPNAFGNMIQFSLPYSEIAFNISSTQWIRPDSNADPEVLWPDIMVNDEDALSIALEYLSRLGEYD